MQMDAGLDTGPMLLQESLAIAAEDDAGSLHDRLSELGSRLIVRALSELIAGRIRPTPQPAEGVTYARKVTKGEARLDWTKPAAQLERAVRAFRPAPGATARLGNETIKIWRARVVAGRALPGTVVAVDGEIAVACGEGALAIAELQREGGKRLAAVQFLRGRAITPGERFE